MSADEKQRICPPGSWDVHHHIFEQYDRFPLSPTRHFTPPLATLAEFRAFQHSLGIEKFCISHGLSFGVDSSSLIYFIQQLGGAAVAYTCIDLGTVTDEEIKSLTAKASQMELILAYIRESEEYGLIFISIMPSTTKRRKRSG